MNTLLRIAVCAMLYTAFISTVMATPSAPGNDARGIREHHGIVYDTAEYSYEALPNGTVRFTMTNTLPVTISGDLIRENLFQPSEGVILTEFSVPPGGQFTYLDDEVIPDRSYLYVFEYLPEGEFAYIFNLDTVNVYTTTPALGKFSLIVTSYDDEYEWLNEGYTINIDKVNIKANTGDDTGITKSVVFYLNGKKYKDNTYPFSLFGDVHGDYKKGRLKNGSYTLTAIAYPQKNGKGIPGDTITVNFNVDILYYDDYGLTVFPNPMAHESGATVQIKGDAYEQVEVEICSLSGGYRKCLYSGKLNNEGNLELQIPPGLLKKGMYVLRAWIEGEIVHEKIVVE